MAKEVDRRSFLKGAYELGALAVGEVVAFGDLIWASTLPERSKGGPGQDGRFCR